MTFNFQCRKAECPSFNGQCSARGLAKLAGCMACKGGLPDGSATLMTEETWRKMHAEPVKRVDVGLGFKETTFTQGGVHLYG